MKRIITIILALVISSLALLTVVSADTQTSDVEQGTSTIEGQEDIKAYIKERIVPVVVGVVTAAIALLTTLGKIKKAMCDLGASREEIKKEAQLRDLSFKEKSEYIQARIDEVNEALKDVPEVQVQLAALKKDAELLLQEMKAFCEILTLGFSANAEIIRSGKGKQMSQLLAKLDAIEAKEVVNNDEN